MRLTPQSIQNLACSTRNLAPHSWQNFDIFILALIAAFVLESELLELYWPLFVAVTAACNSSVNVAAVVGAMVVAFPVVVVVVGELSELS